MGQGYAASSSSVGSNPNDSGRWGDYSACALLGNFTTRGIVYCGGEFGGVNTALGGFGWDTSCTLFAWSRRKPILRSA